MTTLQIQVEQDRVWVIAPYAAEWVSAAKRLGGRWDSQRRNWHFAARDLEAVREACRKVYGTDGSAVELCTLQVRVSGQGLPVAGEKNGATLWLGSRKLAYRPGRDSRVSLGDGVVVSEGDFGSCGGSMKHPRVLNGRTPVIVLEVRDVPRRWADEMIAAHPGAVWRMDEQTQRRATLRGEREALRARLAEVERELEELGEPAPEPSAEVQDAVEVEVEAAPESQCPR